VSEGTAAKTKIRAFVAIHPDPATVTEVEHLQAKLKQELDSPGVRWTAIAQLHLTLQFLGYVDRKYLPDFENALAKVCSQIAPFQLGAQGVGCFPSQRKPRVLWVGLNGEVERLAQMKSALDAGFSTLGFVPEERKFHPHLTLARIEHLKLREIETFSRQITANETTRFGAWAVEKVDLMQSILSSTGPKYSLLKAFSLNPDAARR
jgi:2'-5' RNA ligase